MKVIRSFIVLSVLSFFYGPLLFMVAKAFIDQEQFSLHWFTALFLDPSFWTALKNSFIIATVSSFVSVVLATLAVLGKKKSREESKLLNQMMLMSLSFPEIILSLSLLSLLVLVKWPLGLTTMIIGHTTLTLSFAYFILSLQMQKLNPTLVEAAEDLGASPGQIRQHIQLPWLKNSIISSYFLCFILSLDDFLISFFVSGVGQDTLPIKLFSLLKMGITPKINALSFLIFSFSFIMILIVYPVLKTLRRNQNEPSS